MISTTCLRFLLVLVFLTCKVTAVVTTLDDETWLERVQGKSVFVFFDEPENEDCRALDHTWEKLAAEWEGHNVGLVARVDCGNAASEIICEEYGVVSLPVLLYGDPDSPEFYEDDDMSYETLSAFAKKHLSHPPCNIPNMEHCGDKERQILNDLLAKPRQELEDMEATVDERVLSIEHVFDAQIAEIQAQYAKLVTEYNAELDQVRKETNYKWLQQVLRHLDEKEGVAYEDEL